MQGLRVGAATADIVGDDSMAIAGGIAPRFVSDQEGRIGASAVIAEGAGMLCVVSCDVLMAERDLLDAAAREIEALCGIPFENILIAATHTHHAPSTVRVHGYDRDPVFSKRLQEAIVAAAQAASAKLQAAPSAELRLGMGMECTVGQNSRLLLGDGTIYWVGPMDDVVRPTGPFDPDLPVIAFQGANGTLQAMIFSHSTHNIGSRLNRRSPGIYGLAAQELGDEFGAPVLYLPGAAGSTHNLGILGPTHDLRVPASEESILRIKAAAREALSFAEARPLGPLRAVRKEIEYAVRSFDGESEQAAVSYYCRKRISDPEPVIDVFRTMRRELSAHQGERRKTWLQVLLLGDVALVGVPGELFTGLGRAIKRRSPFRYTYIVELANDYIGYIPDAEAYRLGGYQVWTGYHSYVAQGTGEMIVDEAVRVLDSLYAIREGECRA